VQKKKLNKCCIFHKENLDKSSEGAEENDGKSKGKKHHRDHSDQSNKDCFFLHTRVSTCVEPTKMEILVLKVHT
jgi:hypothetical protein